MQIALVFAKSLKRKILYHIVKKAVIYIPTNNYVTGYNKHSYYSPDQKFNLSAAHAKVWLAASFLTYLCI